MERKFSLQDFGLGLAAGIAVGTIAGILLAPETGQYTRDRLFSSAENLKLTAQDLVDNAKSSLDMAASRLDSVLGSQEKGLKKRLGAIREELDKYNLNGA